MDGIGIDLTDIARFADIAKDAEHAFIVKAFTPAEREYCLAHASPAEHFAGIFAAKEAAWKAMQGPAYPAYAIEIRHADSGAPEAWKDGERLPLRISITHASSVAAAVAAA